MQDFNEKLADYAFQFVAIFLMLFLVATVVFGIYASFDMTSKSYDHLEIIDHGRVEHIYDKSMSLCFACSGSSSAGVTMLRSAVRICRHI